VRHLTLVTIGALAVVAACDGDAAQPTPGGPTGTGEAVSIFDFGYDPATLTIGAGDTVTWTNDGSAPHTVTFADGRDSGTLNAGATFAHTFAEGGEFTYACTIHPAMRGTVNVLP
jgi:plastocyanin